MRKMQMRKTGNMGIIVGDNGSGKGVRVFEKANDGRALLEAVWWVFHHSISKTTAASQTLDFFQSTAGASNLVTNLTTSSQLAKPNEFYLYGVSVTPDYGTPIADLNLLYNGTIINFTISGKSYLNQRAYLIPASGLSGTASAATTVAATTIQTESFSNLAPLQNSYYSILVDGIPQHIVDQEAFTAQLVVTATGVFSGAFNVIYGLHGVLARPIV